MSVRARAKAYVRRRLAKKPEPRPIVAEVSESSNDLAPRGLELRGAALELQDCQDTEILLEGPARTGKSLGALQKCYSYADAHPGSRILFVRQVKATLAESILASFEQYVLPPNHPEQNRVKRKNRSVYTHVNGSIFACAGMDDPNKLLSTEWDLIYFGEALESQEDGYEMLLGRLSGNAGPYQQIIADCNPGHPKHYLNVRAGKPGRPGAMTRLKSKHEDNPRWHDGTTWTAAGKRMLDILDRMTGARFKRFRQGIWAASEGVIYGEALEETHWVDSIDKLNPQQHWRYVWVVDFGYENPFVWWMVAIDEDGRAYRVKEIYHTGLLVEDAAKMILAAAKGYPTPEVIICDHDAEGRATLEKHIGMRTIAAVKNVRAGIDAVKSRLKLRPDGRPGILFCSDSLVHEHDPYLIEQKKPVCSDDEFATYEWKPGGNAKGEDIPKKLNDHGMDVLRYLIAWLDGIEDYGADAPLQVYSAPRVAGSSFF